MIILEEKKFQMALRGFCIWTLHIYIYCPDIIFF